MVRGSSEGISTSGMTMIDTATDKEKNTKISPANVTLVKPVQAPMDTPFEADSSLKNIRPKVGRSFGARQKLSENAEGMTKEGLAEIRPHEEKKNIELREPSSHIPQWSFQSILVCVALFILINIGFMALFHANHPINEKSLPVPNNIQATMPTGENVPPPLEAVETAPSVTASVAPVQSSAIATSQTAAPQMPVSQPSVSQVSAVAVTAPQAASTVNQEAASAVVAPVSSAPSEAEKAENQKALLSILGKN